MQPRVMRELPQPSPPSPVPVTDASTDSNHFNSTVPTASAIPLSPCRTTGPEAGHWLKTGFLSFTCATAHKTMMPTASTPGETGFETPSLGPSSPETSLSAFPLLSRAEGPKEFVDSGYSIRERATVSKPSHPMAKAMSPVYPSRDRCASAGASMPSPTSFPFTTNLPQTQLDHHRMPIRAHDSEFAQYPPWSSSLPSAVAYPEAALMTERHTSNCPMPGAIHPQKHDGSPRLNSYPQFADRSTSVGPDSSPGSKDKTKPFAAPLNSRGPRVLRRKDSFQGPVLPDDWSKENTDNATTPPRHSKYSQVTLPELKDPIIRTKPRDDTIPRPPDVSAVHEREVKHSSRKTSGADTGNAGKSTNAESNQMDLKKQIAFLKKQKDFYHAECEFLRELARKSGVVIPPRDMSRVDAMRRKTRKQRPGETQSDKTAQVTFMHDTAPAPVSTCPSTSESNYLVTAAVTVQGQQKGSSTSKAPDKRPA